MFKKVNEIKEGKWLNSKSFLVCLVMAFSFLLVPQIIGSILYYGKGFDESISIIIGNIVLSILFILVFFRTLKQHFIDFKSNFKENIFTILKYWGIGLAIMMFSNFILNTFVFPGKIADNEEINRTFMFSFPIISFFEIVFVAPFLEEMMFRFGIRKCWGNNKAFPIVTGLVFGLLHALTGVNSTSDLIFLLYTIPYGALGYVFGYLYNKSDNVIFPMLAHLFHNLFCYILLLIVL